MFCPSLEVMVCFCADSLASVSLSRLDVYGFKVFDLFLLADKEPV